MSGAEQPVLYEGSPEHKGYLSRWGPGALRTDKTPCPREVDPEVAASILATEIQRGIAERRVSAVKAGRFPRYVWGRSSFTTRVGQSIEIVWEAEVVNRGLPSYKAYPIQPDRHSAHMPPAVRAELWPDL